MEQLHLSPSQSLITEIEFSEKIIYQFSINLFLINFLWAGSRSRYVTQDSRDKPELRRRGLD